MNTPTSNLDPDVKVLIDQIDAKINHLERQVFALNEGRNRLIATNLVAVETGRENRIIRAVSIICEIPESLLMSRDRSWEVALARQIAITLIRERLRWNLVKIGELFKRDHGTIISAVSKIKALLPVDREVQTLWDRIVEHLDKAEGKATP